MDKRISRERSDFIGMVGNIVCAYVSNNYVARSDLPRLIDEVHAAISMTVTGGPTSATEVIEMTTPAQVKRSLADEGIISFIDGRSYQTLKRHLTSHGLTPERYRERYGLPADYPMICRSYSERRSKLAKEIGLGVPGARTEAQSARRRKAA